MYQCRQDKMVDILVVGKSSEFGLDLIGSRLRLQAPAKLDELFLEFLDCLWIRVVVKRVVLEIFIGEFL